MRIGVISDTHIPFHVKELPLQLADVFAGVKLILHAGDVYVTSVLDELETLAPVFAAYGDGDERWGIKMQADLRMKKSHIVDLEGVRIGLTHSLGHPEDSVERVFGCVVDIAVCGHTHEASVQTHQGVVIINPGSATLPNHLLSKSGTVALIDLRKGKTEVQIVQLGQSR